MEKQIEEGVKDIKKMSLIHASLLKGRPKIQTRGLHYIPFNNKRWFASISSPKYT